MSLTLTLFALMALTTNEIQAHRPHGASCAHQTQSSLNLVRSGAGQTQTGRPDLVRSGAQLQAELEQMGDADQAARRWMVASDPKGDNVIVSKPPSEADVKRMMEVDQQNMSRLAEIIDAFGWPRKSVVGIKASEAAFLILQHSTLENQQRYFPLFKEAAEHGEARRDEVAMMEDRIRLAEGNKQIYGTQLRSGLDTGGRWVLEPIEDEANVDARRAAVGLPPLAEYLKAFGLEYTPTER